MAFSFPSESDHHVKKTPFYDQSLFFIIADLREIHQGVPMRKNRIDEPLLAVKAQLSLLFSSFFSSP